MNGKFLLVSIVSLFGAACVAAPSPTVLPREVGPFKLGQSVDEIRKEGISPVKLYNVGCPALTVDWDGRSGGPLFSGAEGVTVYMNREDSNAKVIGIRVHYGEDGGPVVERRFVGEFGKPSPIRVRIYLWSGPEVGYSDDRTVLIPPLGDYPDNSAFVLDREFLDVCDSGVVFDGESE